MKITDYRPDDSDEEIDVVVRYPAAMRTLAQLDRIRMETSQGLIPIGNFVEMTPEAKTGKIRRVEGQPSITVRADVAPEIGRAHVCTPVTNATLACRRPLV